jgi:uncharacterized membrane protein
MCERILMLFAVLLSGWSSCIAASITTLPDLSHGQELQIIKLMPDGQSVMGVAGDEVFRWTPAGNRVVIGQLPQFANSIEATAISGDGSTIVGTFYTGATLNGFRWTTTAGVQILELPTDFNAGFAPAAVSHDGTSAVGTYAATQQGGAFTAASFRWTSQSGTEKLNLPGEAYVMSGDGSVIAGSGSRYVFAFLGGGFRWPIDSVVGLLPDPPGLVSRVTNISSDGRVTIGTAVSPGFPPGSGPIAVRWVESGPAQPLGSIGDSAQPWATSGDGRVIIGDYVPSVPLEGPIAHPFVWDETNGIRPLQEVIAEHGLTMNLATLIPDSDHLRQVSDNGLVMLGESVRVTRQAPFQRVVTHWVVNLDVPEPSACCLSIMCVVCRYRPGRGSIGA